MKKKRVFGGKQSAALSCLMAFAISLGVCGVEAADSRIDEEMAQEIALSDAGVQEKDVQRLNARYDKEDGEDVYEVEFICGQTEYEYLLRESDGMILEWSVEGRDVGEAAVELSLTAAEKDEEEQSGKKAAADGTQLIGIDAAKELVLQDSGIAASDAVFTSVKFEYDGRYYDYEIEVKEGRAEYEYKLDAETGEILESERD